MSMKAMKVELENLKMEKEALSYKQFWTGSDYARNREITDLIYQYERALNSNKF